MLFCPFCDGQGLIDKARIKDTGTKIYICEECDTMWTEKDIREDNCINFEEYMNKLGLKGLWEELIDVQRM